MTLQFLTPSVTPSGPPPESPLAGPASREGATIGLCGGWLAPIRFTTLEREAEACRETVGWSDASGLGKFELHSPPDCTRGIAVRRDGAWWCPVAPARTLVLADFDRTAALGRRLGARAVDVTTQHGAIVLQGPCARETIARFCALDLRPQTTPPGGFRPGSVARTPGYVLCQAPERYLVVFGAALAEYIWAVVSEAGARLGGRPVGADAHA